MLYNTLCLILVGLLWGGTNPLIKRGSKGIDKIKAPNRISQFFQELKFLFTNWKYLLPFLLNQSGSVVYFLTLSNAGLSYSVPIANSISFVSTAIVGKLIGEDNVGWRSILGICLILAGITISTVDSVMN